MDLNKLIPWKTYHDEDYTADFQRAVGKELEVLQRRRDDLYLQFRPGTADWGLSIFEKEYGIKPDKSKSIVQRLTRWRAKRRGRGTTTTEVIRKIAEDLTGFPAEVLEYPEEDRFEIRLSSDQGTPINSIDMVDLVEEIKPAHLGAYFCSRLRTNNAVHAAALSYARTGHNAALPRISCPKIRAAVYMSASAPTYYRHQAGGVMNYG